MTKLAIIADIHGNVDALKAVLNDIERNTVDGILNLGDHFSGPLAAAETADLLMAHDFMTIRGNHERELLETDPSQMGTSDKIAYNQLPATAMEWIKSQPSTHQYSQDIFMCHANPHNDLDYFLEQVLSDGTVTLNSESAIAEMAGNINSQIILCGHTHIPRVVSNGTQLIINPGSVGCPAYSDETPFPHRCETGSPEARYAIIENINGIWQTSLHAVSYDASRMIKLAEKNGSYEWAQALLKGRVA